MWCASGVCVCVEGRKNVVLSLPLWLSVCLCVCVCVCVSVCVYVYLLSPADATKGLVALVTVVATEPKEGVLMVALLVEEEGLRKLDTGLFARRPVGVWVYVCVCVWLGV